MGKMAAACISMSVGRSKGKRQTFVAVCLSLCFYFFLSASAQAMPRIETVTAQVTSTATIPTPVRTRMEKSVAAIAQQILAGKPVEVFAVEQMQDENLIREVFDKVLVGYAVENVAIAVTPVDVDANQAMVTVRLTPWASRVEQVQMRLAVDGMPPAVEAMVRQDLQGVDAVFARNLDGLPVAAMDWANGILKESLRQFMAVHLPSFRADFDIAAGTTTVVSLTVYPRVPVIRTVDLNMRSDTMPNVMLLEYRNLMQEKANLLLGVPVVFARRHAQTFTQMMAETLDSQRDFQALDMTTQVELTIGEQTRVMSRSNSKRYRLRLEGQTDVGRGQGEGRTRFRLHAGQMLSPKDEAYLQADVFPDDLTWDWSLGYAHDASAQFSWGGRYDFRRDGAALLLYYRLHPRWLLRYEQRFGGDLDAATGWRRETALGYRMHDFLRVELVRGEAATWLRFLGDF